MPDGRYSLKKIDYALGIKANPNPPDASNLKVGQIWFWQVNWLNFKAFVKIKEICPETILYTIVTSEMEDINERDSIRCPIEQFQFALKKNKAICITGLFD